ncbi:MAG TPA: DUF2235 domain-containing protein [Hyphomicrobiaceae bacterium]|nr:DUF2235 domain-containing protein [Hyphomicrobiaceae bacterium]
MKRIVLCFDGTWNTLTNPDEATNVVRVGQALKPVASDGVQQIVYYNSGVGSGGFVDQFLGGVFGAGLKSNVKRGLTFLSFNYNTGETPDDPPDEIYIFGFSRGAYTARALAGVIGAIGGIPKVSSFGEVEQFWTHYKQSKESRKEHDDTIKQKLYPLPKSGKLIKCVAVWDTVGSYGVPAGAGLTGLARTLTSWTRNFRDNEIGKRIEYGYHAMAIDERRRAFPATAWVPRTREAGAASDPELDALPEPEVEQVWFAGAHANVGGGYAQTGLSDQALLWMMARVQDQTQLEFDVDYIQKFFLPCAACSSYRSYKGWWLSSLWPYVRAMPKVVKNAAGVAGPAPGDTGAILDGRVHWSVKERLNRLCLVDQDRYRKYAPKNLADDAIFTEHNVTEDTLIALCRNNPENERRQSCALRRNLDTMTGGRTDRRRAKRMRRLRDSWTDILAAQG